MAIGKREQIVIGVISAIVLIAILHAMIFDPSHRQFIEKKTEWDGTVDNIKKLKTIPPGSPVLANYTKETSRYLDELTSGMTALKMDEPQEFIVPSLDDLKEDGKGGADESEDQRKARREKIMQELQEKQVDYIMAEIDKLRQYIGNERVKMTFLGQNGWNLPPALPPAMQSNQIWDQLTVIADIRGTLDQLGTNSPVYNNVRNQYAQNLRTLGLDMQHANRLKSYGEFVPVIYRLAVASLILKQFPSADQPPRMILNAELNRKRLFKILEIEIPFDEIEGNKETKAYLLFEELRGLNYLLEMALKGGLVEVSEVIFRGYAYLREDTLEPADKRIINPRSLPDDETDDPKALIDESQPNQGMGMYGMPGMMMPGMMPGMMMPGMMPGMPGAAGGQGGPGGAPGMPGMMPGMPGMMPGMPGMMPGMPGMMPGMPGMTGPNGEKPKSAEEIRKEAEKAFVKPRPKEIGFALPIKVTFLGTNVNVFTYTYDVLREKPMAELHRLFLKSMSQRNPNDVNVQATATFTMVPKLFGTMDEVNKMIKEIQNQDKGGPAPAAGAKTAAATGAGAIPGAPPVPGRP